MIGQSYLCLRKEQRGNEGKYGNYIVLFFVLFCSYADTLLQYPPAVPVGASFAVQYFVLSVFRAGNLDFISGGFGDGLLRGQQAAGKDAGRGGKEKEGNTFIDCISQYRYPGGLKVCEFWHLYHRRHGQTLWQ